MIPAFLVTVAGGRAVTDAPICLRCANERWHAIVRQAPTTGDPDAPCGNCGRALRHGLCVIEDGAAFAADGRWCEPCTEDEHARLRDVAEFEQAREQQLRAANKS